MKRDSTAYAATLPSWDTNDCSVRTLAVATGVNYETASAVFAAQGRVGRKGTSTELSRRLYEDHLGMKAFCGVREWRLDQFLELVQVGTFIIHSRTHAFAVIDGTVHDWEHGGSRPSTRIEEVWKVTRRAREKMQGIQAAVEGL